MRKNIPNRGTEKTENAEGIALSAFISYFILYLVIKAAVRNGIWEAGLGTPQNNPNAAGKAGAAIATVECSACKKEHDIDYPKCPHCGFEVFPQ